MEVPQRQQSSSFTAVAPGRLCLFGEHQDYLGFPVIAFAIPLHVRIRVEVTTVTTAPAATERRVDGDVALQGRIGSSDDSADDVKERCCFLPIIYFHLPEGLGGTTTGSSSTKVYDLNHLPPSPPPPSSSSFGPGDDQDDDATTNPPPDFWLAAIHEVLKEGWQFPSSSTTTPPMVVHCTSISNNELPVQAGCSSSTAVLSAWVLILAQLTGHYQELVDDPLKLAQLTYRAEVLHFGHPGGTMDHVCIAIGGERDDNNNNIHNSNNNDEKDTDPAMFCLRIGPGMWEVEKLPFLLLPTGNNDDHGDGDDGGDDNGVWILADSGQPKDTLGHLKRCKEDRLTLQRDRLHGDWDYYPSRAAGRISPTLDKDSEWTPTEKDLLEATLVNRDTERQAAAIWRSLFGKCHRPSGVSIGEQLAQLMKKHHEALRDGLGLSTPRLEAMNDAAIGAGAWAFKVVGSGGGGCGVAWAPTSRADFVARAMKESGAVNCWILKQPSGGAKLIFPELKGHSSLPTEKVSSSA